MPNPVTCKTHSGIGLTWNVLPHMPPERTRKTVEPKAEANHRLRQYPNIRNDVVPCGNLTPMITISCAGKRLKSGKQYHGHGVLNGRRDRAGVDLRADEGSPSRETSFRPACRTVERPRQTQAGQASFEIEALRANGSTQKFIVKRYKSSPANLANWMKKRGIKKPNL